MSQAIFFWLSWMLWAVITFILPKTSFRWWAAIAILSLMISSSMIINISVFSISLAFFVILITTVTTIAKINPSVRTIFVTFTISMGYTGMLLWEQVSPVWVLMPRLLLFAVISFSVISLIADKYLIKIAIWGMGSAFGEIIYAVIISDIGFTDTVVDIQYLNLLVLVLWLFTITEFGKRMAMSIEQLVTTVSNRRVG